MRIWDATAAAGSAEGGDIKGPAQLKCPAAIKEQIQWVAALWVWNTSQSVSQYMDRDCR